MTRLRILSFLAVAILVGSWLATEAAPSPWDLLVLVMGVAGMPFFLGVICFGEGASHWYQGPQRIEAGIITVVGLILALIGGRVLLAIFGWH